MSLSPAGFLRGLVVGSAVGAVAALLCAPAEGPALRRLRGRPSIDRDPYIDDEIDQSFPASDPPSWTSTTSTTAW